MDLKNKQLAASRCERLASVQGSGSELASDDATTMERFLMFAGLRAAFALVDHD